jgi:hypothetical protein
MFFREHCMTKISLATYTLQVKEKKKEISSTEKNSEEIRYLKLDNITYSTLFSKGNLTVLELLKNIFKNKPVGFAKNERAITINEFFVDEEKRIIYGTFYYGTYGSEQSVLEIDNTENLEESKNIKIGKKDCPVIPYYFFIKLPLGRYEGLVIFEKKGVYGIKTAFEEWLKNYLLENNIRIEFDIEPFTPEAAIKQYAEEGKIREIRYLSYTLPNEEIELLKGYEPNEGYYEMRFVFPKRAENLKKLPSKLKSLLMGNKDVEIHDKMLGGLDPDDIKINVVLDGSPRTFTISNPTKAAPYRDISMEIIKGEDGHPDFTKIHEIAVEYANQIFK